MQRGLLLGALALASACGRIGFDALGDAQAGSPPFTIEMDLAPTSVRAIAMLPDAGIAVVGRAAVPGAHFAGGSLQSFGDEDVFLAVLEPTGVLRWVKTFGGTGHDDPNAIAVTPDGEIYIAGSYGAPLSFGGPVLPAPVSKDAFLVKFTAAGDYQMAITFGTPGDGVIAGIAFAPDGDVAISGAVSGTVDFGGGMTAASGALSEAFIARYSSAGALRWVHRYGDSATNYAESVAFDSGGNLYAVGLYEATPDFGGGPAPNRGGQDAMLLALDGAGAFRWVRTWGGAGTDWSLGVAVTGTTVVASGFYDGSIDLPVPVLAGAQHGLLAAFSTAGAPGWNVAFGTTGCNRAAVVTSVDDGFAAAGMFTGTITLGGMTKVGRGVDPLVFHVDPAGTASSVISVDDQGDGVVFGLATGARTVIAGRTHSTTDAACMDNDDGVGFLQRL